jgi:hypothetical protein
MYHVALFNVPNMLGKIALQEGDVHFHNIKLCSSDTHTDVILKLHTIHLALFTPVTL